MPTKIENFALISNALTASEIEELRHACKRHLAAPNSIPSYVLLEEQNATLLERIKVIMETATGEELFYLNDFYLYTDKTSQAEWHVDTELFTFDRSYNAWILLSPETVESPLAVMTDYNSSEGTFFHSVKISGDECRFTNFANMKTAVDSLSRIESTKEPAPDVATGDILILNPKKFHRTNVKSPKHILALKFLARGAEGLESPMQVPGMLWKETKLFNEILKSSTEWSDFTAGVRRLLTTDEGREALSAGFFPEKISLYRKMVTRL